MIYYYINKLGVLKSLHAHETEDGQFEIGIVNELNGEHCGTGKCTREQLGIFLGNYQIVRVENE